MALVLTRDSANIKRQHFIQHRGGLQSQQSGPAITESLQETPGNTPHAHDIQPLKHCNTGGCPLHGDPGELTSAKEQQMKMLTCHGEQCGEEVTCGDQQNALLMWHARPEG